MISARHILLGGTAIGLAFAPVMDHSAQAQPVADEAIVEGISPQRLAAGEGDSAGPKAPTARRGGSGFLNTKVIIGVLVAGATAVVVLEASADDDSIPSSTATTTN